MERAGLHVLHSYICNFFPFPPVFLRRWKARGCNFLSLADAAAVFRSSQLQWVKGDGERKEYGGEGEGGESLGHAREGSPARCSKINRVCIAGNIYNIYTYVYIYIYIYIIYIYI